MQKKKLKTVSKSITVLFFDTSAKKQTQHSEMLNKFKKYYCSARVVTRLNEDKPWDHQNLERNVYSLFLKFQKNHFEWIYRLLCIHLVSKSIHFRVCYFW